MSQPYIGECRLVGFNFQVNGWNFCNGSLVGISQYSALYQLIGTTYGGDGNETFGLPDLQGRVPVHQGGTYVIGQRGGAESVTLNQTQIPIHNHPTVASSSSGVSNSAQGNLPAANANVRLYVSPGAVDSSMNPLMISNAGGSLPHDNMQPFLTMNWIISLFGVFPTPN